MNTGSDHYHIYTVSTYHIYITSTYHIYISYLHITSTYHIYISYLHVISTYHIYISHLPIISSDMLVIVKWHARGCVISTDMIVMGHVLLSDMLVMGCVLSSDMLVIGCVVSSDALVMLVICRDSGECSGSVSSGRVLPGGRVQGRACDRWTRQILRHYSQHARCQSGGATNTEGRRRLAYQRSIPPLYQVFTWCDHANN